MKKRTRTIQTCVSKMKQGDRVVMSPEPHYSTATVKQIDRTGDGDYLLLLAMGEVETLLDLPGDCRADVEVDSE